MKLWEKIRGKGLPEWVGRLRSDEEVGVLFNVGELGEGAYWREAWKIFGTCFKPKDLGRAALFCGDVEMAVGTKTFAYLIGLWSIEEQADGLQYFSKKFWYAAEEGLAPQQVRLVHGDLRKIHGLTDCISLEPGAVHVTNEDMFGWILEVMEECGWEIEIV